MKPRSLLLLPAALLCLGGATVSRAETVVYDTSAASIVCTTMVGTVSPKPLLTLTPQPTELTIKGKISGCTVAGALPSAPALQVRSGKLSAKLVVTGDASCATLIAGFQVTGNFVVDWKTAPGQALDRPSSSFTPDAGGLVAGLLPVGMTTYGTFTTTGTLTTDSAFAGATPGLLVVSGEDISNMFGQCCTDPVMCSPVGAGIKRLHLAIGQIQM